MNELRYRVTLRAPDVQDWLIHTEEGRAITGTASPMEIVQRLDSGLDQDFDIDTTVAWLKEQQSAGPGVHSVLPLTDTYQLEVVA